MRRLVCMLVCVRVCSRTADNFVIHLAVVASPCVAIAYSVHPANLFTHDSYPSWHIQFQQRQTVPSRIPFSDMDFFLFCFILQFFSPFFVHVFSLSIVYMPEMWNLIEKHSKLLALMHKGAEMHNICYTCNVIVVISIESLPLSILLLSFRLCAHSVRSSSLEN